MKKFLQRYSRIILGIFIFLIIFIVIKNVYASKYLTYLPSKEELIKIIKDEKELIELAQNNEKETNL